MLIHGADNVMKKSSGDFKRDGTQCSPVYAPSGTRVVSSHLLFIDRILEVGSRSGLARDTFHIRSRQGSFPYVVVLVSRRPY
jgi:hypothetical protein